ncbi:MAG: hypothetical protein E6G69_16460 [Alphaproteobacteria bacterium]|nr:MAG: hypothetical protein E6G69_16460 [Alphaproteobacteria bacterium]
MTRVTLGKSRVRESRTPGSVRAKAEWLSYSTITLRAFLHDRDGEGLIDHPAPVRQRPFLQLRETAT